MIATPESSLSAAVGVVVQAVVAVPPIHLSVYLPAYLKVVTVSGACLSSGAQQMIMAVLLFPDRDSCHFPTDRQTDTHTARQWW